MIVKQGKLTTDVARPEKFWVTGYLIRRINLPDLLEELARPMDKSLNVTPFVSLPGRRD